MDKIASITGKDIITTMPEAEPLGPKMPLDCMVIAPLTGNSLSKLANALTDSPVLMAAKATMRNQKPVVVGVSTNDALGLNGVNLMRLMASKFYAYDVKRIYAIKVYTRECCCIYRWLQG